MGVFDGGAYKSTGLAHNRRGTSRDSGNSRQFTYRSYIREPGWYVGAHGYDKMPKSVTFTKKYIYAPADTGRRVPSQGLTRV